MALSFYNTLTRQLAPFAPLEAGQARFYTCGPTIYNFAHVGNFRAYIFEDLLRRTLKYRGYQVTQVMNLTDVDDKTIRAAQAAGQDLKTFTRPFAEAFFQDLKTLNIEAAEYYPAATDHIPEMIALIKRLEERGFAYRAPDGSVYFRIDRFPAYGQLAQLDRAGLKAGARVAQDEYQKDNVADFALWKAWTPADGPVAWDSPWGRGRPGWHIECSAMSMKYLGEQFDLHTGGMDNMFPHHEDEIAQSEAATGKQFARYWLHCAHLMVEGHKMAKSAGNFFTLRDLLERGYTGREIRYVLLATHYRQQLNFTFAGLDAVRATLRRLDEFRQRLEDTAAGGEVGPPPVWALAEQERFGLALDEDLNISGALAGLFDFVHAGHRALDAGAVSPADAQAALRAYEEMDTVLGCLAPPSEQIPDGVHELVALRQAARAQRDFAEADRLREQLTLRGWEVRDTPQGPKIQRVGS